MAEFVGERLRIKTDEGTYEGIVHSIDPVKKRLTLSKVSSCAEGKSPKRLHGFHNFFGHELNNLEILRDEDSANEKELPKREEKDVDKKRENGYNSTSVQHCQHHHHHEPATKNHIQKKEPSRTPVPLQTSTRQQPSQATAMSGIFKNAIKDAGMQMKRTIKPAAVITKDASDEGTNMLHRPPIAPERYLMEDYYSDEEVDQLSPQNPPKTVVMQEYGDRFVNAIKYISGQRVVGLACEGNKLGRYGKVCWIVIGCRQFTYLFDVITLGASCFDEGLGDILESGNILKVIHDCRQISDALYHQYSIKLVNVFDTQVADIIIYQKEKGGKLPRVVNGLVACLYEYLNLLPEECHFQKTRLNYMQKDELIWSRRPLPHQLLDACAKHVMYLRELRLVQMERMLAEFIFGVDIYLGVIRDDKDYKLPDKKNMSKGRLVPQQFQELYKFHHRQRKRKFDEEGSDGTNEDDNSLDPTDNVWQEGRVFSDAYKDKYGSLREHSVRPDLVEATGRGSAQPNNSDRHDERPNTLPPNLPGKRPQHSGCDSDGSGESSSRSFTENIASSYSDFSATTSSNTRNHPGIYGKYQDDERFEVGMIGQASGGVRQHTWNDMIGPASGRVRQHTWNDMIGPASGRVRQHTWNDMIGPASGRVRQHTWNLEATDVRHVGEDIQEHFENEDNAFQFHFSSPEELTADSNNMFISGQRSRQNHFQVKETESIVNRIDDFNLRDDDFPPLSSSQSDSGSPSASPKSRPFKGLRTTNNVRDNTRSLPAVSRGQSSLVRDAMGPVGRGRASLFQHLSNMPNARLPRFEQMNEPSTSSFGVGRNVHAFPTDDELFASPEITHVPDSDSVRGATRVWVRKT